MGEVEKLILAKIRSNFSRGRAAPGSKALYYSMNRKTLGAHNVDDALRSLVDQGIIRITAGRWFEVGISREQLEAHDRKVKALAAARAEKIMLGKLKPPKVDNRKPTKVPRGMKPSAAARTLSLEGVK